MFDQVCYSFIIKSVEEFAKELSLKLRLIALMLAVFATLLACQPTEELAHETAYESEDFGFRTTTDDPAVRSESIIVEQRENPKAHSEFATGRRLALVIGNSDYRGSISSLVSPVNDANAISASLRAVGFEVDLQLDATRDEIKEAVLEFSDKLHESDVGLFYYSGHAVQVDGRNFIIPIGADLNIENERRDSLARYVSLETVDIGEVLVSMKSADADLSIIILDTSRDNPFNGSARGLSRGLAHMLAPRGTFLAYATAPGNVAEDGTGHYSPYTSALTEAIETPGLKLEDVFKQVRREVALQTDGRQTPWENSSIYGDFYFTSSAQAYTPERPPVAAQEAKTPLPPLLSPSQTPPSTLPGDPTTPPKPFITP